MRVGRLAAQLLEPRRAGQHDIREAARGVVQKSSWLTISPRAREACGHGRCIRERRQHVGADEQQCAHPALAHAAVMPGIWLGTQCPARAASAAADGARPQPCASLPWRGPKPPPAMPRLPVSAGRHATARAPASRWRPCASSCRPARSSPAAWPRSGARGPRCVRPARPVIRGGPRRRVAARARRARRSRGVPRDEFRVAETSPQITCIMPAPARRRCRAG